MCLIYNQGWHLKWSKRSNKHHTKKVDVYSFGIVLWELLKWLTPFDKISAEQAAYVVTHGHKAFHPTFTQHFIFFFFNCQKTEVVLLHVFISQLIHLFWLLIYTIIIFVLNLCSNDSGHICIIHMSWWTYVYGSGYWYKQE